MNKKTKIYQASTSELYGLIQESPQKETTPFYPRSPYAVSKVANEYLSNVYMRYKRQLKVTSLNFFNTYGPTEGADAVIPNFVIKAINKPAPTS